MKKTMKINSVEFEILKPYTNKERIIYYNNRTLTDCYTKPSKTKQAIYNSWDKWYRELVNYKEYVIYTDCFGVNSYNGWIFTLSFL